MLVIHLLISFPRFQWTMYLNIYAGALCSGYTCATYINHPAVVQEGLCSGATACTHSVDDSWFTGFMPRQHDTPCVGVTERRGAQKAIFNGYQLSW